MIRWLTALLVIATTGVAAQVDSTKQLRAFPITDYVVVLNDSVKVVQLQLPDGIKIPEKQLGVLRGTYQKSTSDTVQKGYGRCNLIKGDYYYFSIGHNKSGVAPQKGDLIYTFLERSSNYNGRIPQLAGHFILLKTVYEVPLYDRYKVFESWDIKKESALLDSIVADIKFTGNYFQANNNSMDTIIQTGIFKGKRILQTMMDCKRSYIEDFLDYMIARPQLYAGREWMVSEIFATWLSSGAPRVISR